MKPGIAAGPAGAVGSLKGFVRSQSWKALAYSGLNRRSSSASSDRSASVMGLQPRRQDRGVGDEDLAGARPELVGL